MVLSYCGHAPDPALIASVAHIYELSFPAWQRIPSEVLLLAVANGQRTLWVDTSAASFGVTLSLSTVEPSTALEYLAVHPDRRSRGLGGQLLDEIIRKVNKPMVLEVEDPDHAATPESKRRVSFYERHGARLVTCATGYAMPSLDNEVGTGLIPMLLHEVPLHPPEQLRGDALRSLVKSIWVDSYDQSPHDPRLQLMLTRFKC